MSPEERDKKKRQWKHRQETLGHYEIPPFGTPPRNADLDVSLEDDYGEEDQEVLDDLEHEEKEERGATKAMENKSKHDCEGLVCPFVIEDDDDVRCMVWDQEDKRELMERTSKELLESRYGQQLMDDINKDDAAIKAIQAKIAARGPPEEILRKFLLQDLPELQDLPKPVIRIAPVIMGQTISTTKNCELNEESKTDVVWSGPRGKPGITIKICVLKGNTRVTATIVHEDKDVDHSVDENKST